MTGVRITVVAWLAFQVSSAAADCAREDIEFYLEKGFTHEQVSQLCSRAVGGGDSKNYESFTEEYVNRRDAEYEARMRVEREVSLRNSIEGAGVRLAGGWLEYVRKQCVSEGVEKDRIFGLKSCPKIRFRIRMAGLQVDDREYQKRFLFGQKMIRVEGEIQRKLMPGAFADIPDEYWREQLGKKLEQGNSTKIPLRDGVDFHFVYGALTDIVDHETERQQALEDRNVTEVYGDVSLEADDFEGALSGELEMDEVE